MNTDVNGKNCVICGCGRFIAEPLRLRGGITSDERYIPGFSPVWRRCPECGCMVSDGAMFDAEAFYRDDYTFLLENADIEPAIAADQKKYSEVLADFLAPQMGRRRGAFLDIGAGKGNFLTALHRVLPELEMHAVEPSRAFGRLRELSFLRSCRQAFFAAGDYAGENWAGIALIGVLEHVCDPGGFLTQVRSIMNDDTLLLIEVPNFRNNAGDWLVVDHLSKFTPENLEQLLLRRGFSVVEKRVSRSVPMQFLVKKGPVGAGDFSGCAAPDVSAAEVTKFIETILGIDGDCVFFGGNAFTNYTVHAEPDFARRVRAVINDNRFYQGRNYLDTEIPVISYEDFKANFSGLPVILALGRCYYANVLPRLAGEKAVAL